MLHYDIPLTFNCVHDGCAVRVPHDMVDAHKAVCSFARQCPYFFHATNNKCHVTDSYQGIMEHMFDHHAATRLEPEPLGGFRLHLANLRTQQNWFVAQLPEDQGTLFMERHLSDRDVWDFVVTVDLRPIVVRRLHVECKDDVFSLDTTLRITRDTCYWDTASVRFSIPSTTLSLMTTPVVSVAILPVPMKKKQKRASVTDLPPAKKARVEEKK